MKLATIISIVSVLTILPTMVLAGDKPPKDSKPLSEIVKSLEEQGFKQISEIEFDDDKWEVDVYKDNQKLELEVDPSSGKILSNKVDD
ncbi:PepSY domain-containing protein [Nitrosococcus oceani]|uniref:PepSY domain-containing protein n=2 Tax=Nitrosococcus oceani TaxID=1229 RepID=A0A0E2Z0P0_9GAMM|nr:PepSY domain-containing protein [Nitrosococcus oceani]KFI19168.1 hypothetical protein IB75_10120 [Nitrosococcus oceani C-27]ABA58364.1 conserved hypothetical membrane protein [Nitrosococcus oceani ATCC 19707]EDZ67081.1 hypothetical protein NOC27_408 [Nitrosococcus oceani AFC27]KFI22430.1 hypothetical protein HW44_09585 [Nitrosococcus oceani]GEM18753.1 hypothetical protein NONS58_01120 [Nitrosococcus oceani]